MKSGIYKILNLINGKFYIGSAKDIKLRFKSHVRSLRRGVHENKYLQYSYIKYGEYNFKFEIIENCTIDNLIEREQYYIDTLNPDYNICRTAYSRLGTKHSEETKKKIGFKTIGRGSAISKAMKGKKKDRYTIEQIIKANNKSVLQFSKEGIFIREWISIRTASNDLNIKHSCISNCCAGRHKTAGGFIWKLKINN